jgi:hypothetical protein
MSNKNIESMNVVEEIVNANAEIDEQMNKIKTQFKYFEGKRFDEMSTEELDVVKNLMNLIQQLVNAKADLRSIALYKFGIFIF